MVHSDAEAQEGVEAGGNDIVSSQQKGSIRKRRIPLDVGSPTYWSPTVSPKLGFEFTEGYSSKKSDHSLKQLLASEWQQQSTDSRFESMTVDCTTERASAVGDPDMHNSCLPEGQPLATSPASDDFAVQVEKEEGAVARAYPMHLSETPLVRGDAQGQEDVGSSWECSENGGASASVRVDQGVAAGVGDITCSASIDVAGTELRNGSPAAESPLHDVVVDKCATTAVPETFKKCDSPPVEHVIERAMADRDCQNDEPSYSTTGRIKYRIFSEEQLLRVAPEEPVVAINAGGCPLASSTLGFEFSEDDFFSGGDVLKTEELISRTREPLLYQTARYGNVSYAIPNLPGGEYTVNLHFAEIIFTNGPPGMRVFDISIQGRKAISELDVYSLAGSNNAVILSVQTTVSNGVLAISFEGVNGSPTISAISIHKASFCDVDDHHGEVTSTRVERFPEFKTTLGEFRQPAKNSQVLEGEEIRRQQIRSKARQCVKDYELKLDELKKECYEAWMSLEESQTENERLRNELTSKNFYLDTLANVVEGQQDELKELKDKCESDLAKWRSSLKEVLKEAQVLREKQAALSTEAKDWIGSFPDLSTMTQSVQKLVDDHKTLKARFMEESQERKQLYNKVLELKGNIRVFCRCRPLSLAERAVGSSSVIEFERDNELALKASVGPKKYFKFDRVFIPQDGQEEVFADTAPVVVSVLDGYNVCIFAYGQTGTGKTFTMLGSPENRGVNYRTLEELFRVASDRKGDCTYNISVSVLEVYNEQIRDLLAPSPPPGHAAKKLEIKQLAEGVHHVPGLIESEVHSMSEVWEVLQAGSNSRAVGSTNSNEHSSRSHFMLCVMVKGENLITGECTRSKLWLVDLAGSERVTKSDVQGERLKEAQSINKSLASLGDVIHALATKSSHIPYRNSKLTHLLQDSLGGDSKTLMFVQISPNDADTGETVCSLNFASRVRGVELGPVKKQIDSGEMLKYKQQAEKAKQDMKKVEDSLREAETKLKMKEQLCQALADKVRDRDRSITELELQVAAERKSRSGEAQDSCTDRSLEEQLPRRPLTERSLTVELRQSENLENMLKCSTDSSGFRNENLDPDQRTGDRDKLKVLSLRFASPTPQKLLSRRTGRASFAGVPRRSSLLPSSFLVKAGPQTAHEDVPLPLPTTMELLSSDSSPPASLRAPGTASRVVRPSSRRSTMDPSRKDRDKVEEMARRREESRHPSYQRPSTLSSAADRRKTTTVVRVSLSKPLRTVAGSGAQRVLSNRSRTAARVTVTSAVQRERAWN